MKKYTYKNRITGERKYTDSKVKDKNWDLVVEIKNGMIKENKVLQK
jgi:hypothetical protein